MEGDGWEKRIEMERKQKDLFFASHPQSPLAPQDRRAFPGLAYWPPNPEYRFELRLLEYYDKGAIEVADSGGQKRTLRQWGQFRFELGGQQFALEAYKSDPIEERLFIPFRDETSGKESYGAGRYLDLELERHLTEEGKWIVDFNEAYNPWCAYSEDYVCPFVPLKNRLEVPILAGEKQYPLKQR